MPSRLLCSTKTQTFQPLGIAGEPAYRKASALRVAIAAQINPEAASFLAEVQADEDEQQLDWYAPLAGQVLQWTQASEAQRADAMQRIEHLHQQFLATAQRLEDEAKAAQDASGRDKQGIARLLRLAVYYPDHGQIYLVDGQPVITCWGFTRRAQDGTDKVQAPSLFCMETKPMPFSPVGWKVNRYIPVPMRCAQPLRRK